MTWLITGGAGYIGSHVVHAAQQSGYELVVVDNLSNGNAQRLPSNIPLLRANIGDESVRSFMQQHKVDGIVHLAAMKSVGESHTIPIQYWNSNVSQMIQFLEFAQQCSVSKFVFSSSAAVYGQPNVDMISESQSLSPINNYGRTKVAGELLLDSIAESYWLSSVSLRYFNVAGALNSELRDTQLQNLIPIVVDKLRRNLPIDIFGSDFPTQDGTCVRDYVHVVDIAEAHVSAMKYVSSSARSNEKFNLGTGSGTSVLEVVSAVAAAFGGAPTLEYREGRVGDPARLVAEVSSAAEKLGWKAKYGIQQIAKSSLCE